MNDMSKISDPAAPAEPGRLRRLWTWFWSPARSLALGTLLVSGFVGGIVFWGGFNWAMEATNTEAFCHGCHEMKANVGVEWRNTIHYANRSGVRAVCSDCHVPKDWQHKIVRKIQASWEVYSHVMGHVDTKEKFDHERPRLAQNVWKAMKSTDSRECRNCHKFDYMDYAAQEPRASKIHQDGLTSGKTCIDCHRGIAHQLPPRADQLYQQVLDQLGQPQTSKIGDYLKSIVGGAQAAGDTVHEAAR
jgi:cytochrome c-type protein NapC